MKFENYYDLHVLLNYFVIELDFRTPVLKCVRSSFRTKDI